jgi:hypothetical protein
MIVSNSKGKNETTVNRSRLVTIMSHQYVLKSIYGTNLKNMNNHLSFHGDSNWMKFPENIAPTEKNNFISAIAMKNLMMILIFENN